MNKYRRLTKGDIATISEAIADPECRTLAEAARRVGMDPSGIRLPQGKLDEIEALIAPLLKEGNQSLLGIYQSHAAEIPVSIATLYSYVDKKAFKSIRHINSEPRRLLNGNCPGEVARAFLNEKVPGLNGYRIIKPDEVRLTPDLLR